MTEKHGVFQWRRWWVARWPIGEGDGELLFGNEDNAKEFLEAIRNGDRERADYLAQKRLSRKKIVL